MKICKACSSEEQYIGNSPYCPPCREEKRRLVNATNKAKAKLINIDYSEKNRVWLVKSIYGRYKRSAKSRGHSFELTIEQMNMFFHAECYYCGDKLKSVGLDRINNDIGYILSNIVPCCEHCNRMKFKGSIKDLLERCKKIVTKWNGLL